MIKLEPKKIFEEYQKGVTFNNQCDLYTNVQRNEHFFTGDQWWGVNAPPDLDKPVFNILKRVCTFFISSIVSDDISAQVSQFGQGSNKTLGNVMQMISGQIDEVIENTKLKTKNRKIIRNGCVDGGSALYFYYDNTIDTGQSVKGKIEAEIIDNTNIMFGNPQVNDVQLQPYIIIMMRKTVESVKEEAKRNGISEDLIDTIQADDESSQINGDNKEENKVTVLVKFFKKIITDAEGNEKTSIHAIKVTNNVVVQNEVDLGYRLYPIAWFTWDEIKNSYHGQAAITGLIPNQIFINKLFAMSMQHVKAMAFPKVIYNKNLISRWSNAVGESIGVNGDLTNVIATGYKAPDMSNQVMMLIEKTIQYTRDTMGASDAALGNIKPDNTSAIIAVQKSSSMPLELQRMDFYQFVEDYIRIIIDMMSEDYGTRDVIMLDDEGNEEVTSFDFDTLKNLYLKLDVSIGASAYWSELMQVQTIDNLFAKGIITDAVLYLESIPDGYIPNKQEIIQSVKAMQLQAQQQAQMQNLPPELLNGLGGATDDMQAL